MKLSLSDRASESAEKAIMFLENHFNRKSSTDLSLNISDSFKLSLISSKNTYIPSLAVRTESWDDDIRSVDDAILRCCSLILREKTESYVYPYLITEDTNLRLKARGSNIPTGSMKDFMKWANMS